MTQLTRSSPNPVRFKPSVCLLALGVLALWCAGCGGNSSVETRTVPGEPGLQYKVHSDFLYLRCAGDGSPTVLLEAGLGGDHRDWSLVQPEIARTTRVCSYDRSGLGFSQLAPKRRSAREKANDLRALLAAAGIEGPYVLVGHSYGGMLARVYAAAEASDVVGLVLLDSSHPDQGSRFLAALPPRREAEPQPLRKLRKELVVTLSNPEGVDWNGSSQQTRDAGPLGEKPLIVVTAGETDPAPELAALPGIVHRLDRAWLGCKTTSPSSHRTPFT